MNLEAIIEALTFAAGDPIDVADITKVTGKSVVEIQAAIDVLRNKYTEDSGVKLLVFGSKLQFCTHPGAAEYIENLLYPVHKRSLSQAALEVLSIIAYKQPVTRAEIEAIRGVQCDYSVANLTSKGLIEEVGRKDTIGRPVMFGTTDEFLKKFGMSSLGDLPEKDLTLLEQPAEEE